MPFSKADGNQESYPCLRSVAQYNNRSRDKRPDCNTACNWECLYRGVIGFNPCLCGLSWLLGVIWLLSNCLYRSPEVMRGIAGSVYSIWENTEWETVASGYEALFSPHVNRYIELLEA